VLRDYTQDRAAIYSALDHHLTAYPWSLTVGFNPMKLLATSLGTLEQVAKATSGHPGHKNIIWIGKGFPGIDLTGDSIDQQAAQQLTSAVEAVINHLRDARITLYTIDPTPLSSTIQSVSNDASTTGDDDGISAPDPFAGDINFMALAPATGGKAFYSRNDIDRELAESVRYGTEYYTLSYRPPPATTDVARPFRKIRVRFDERGLQANYRQGYYTKTDAPEPVDPRRVQYDLYAAETGTMAYTGFTMAAMRKPGTADTFVVAVLEKQLQWTEDDPAAAAPTQSAKLTLVATALDKKGAMLRRATTELTARRPAAQAATAAADAVARFEIQLPDAPKALKVRFVLRGADGRIGTADIDAHTGR
jgi:hypothetical protein